VSDCAQAKKLWRHIILHLIQPTVGNTAFPSIVFGALGDFTTFENWFRCMHNARMTQLIMDGSLQALKRLYDTADASGETHNEVLSIFELFRPLASDIIAEANHHETRYPSRAMYPEKCDYVMVPALPNQLSALVDQVMLQEADHWRKQSALAMNAFSEAQESPAGEAAKYNNCVQVDFDINFRLITPNFYDNRSNSSGECCQCDPGGQFLGDALFHRSCVCIPCLVAARPFHKRTFLCHSRLILYHSSTFITLMSLKFRTLYAIQKHSYVIRAPL